MAAGKTSSRPAAEQLAEARATEQATISAHASMLNRAATDTSVEPLAVAEAEHAIRLARIRREALEAAAQAEQQAERVAAADAAADRYLAAEPAAMAAFEASCWDAERALLRVAEAARQYGAVAGAVAAASDAYGDASPRLTRSHRFGPPMVDGKPVRGVTAGAWISRVARRALAETSALEGVTRIAGRVPELTDTDPQLHPKSLSPQVGK